MELNRNLGLSLVRVTELAAIESAKWLGRGDKNAADQAAVNGMRRMFDTIDIDGTVVIGEGEKDEAPMLYIGEQIGKASEKSIAVDIAVDPLDGTTSTALGRSNAVSIIAVAPKGCVYKTDFYYMDKIAVGPKAKGVININDTVEENLVRVAEALGKPIEELTITTIDRERSKDLIAQCRELGCRIQLFSDGDVGAAIATCYEESGIDVMLGVGGAPEGVLAAAALKCLGGEIQTRLYPFTDEEKEIAAKEDVTQLLTMDDLIKGDDVLFTATGVSDGDLTKGVKFLSDHVVKTHSVVMRSKTGTVRYIEATHKMETKPEYAK